MPAKSSHRPDLDTSLELAPEEASHCQSLAGTIRWIAELVRIDTFLEVFMMASCVDFPREGYLEQVYRVFG